MTVHLHDWHGFWWNTSVWVNLFENLVDVDWVGFLSSTFCLFFTFWSSCSFAGFGNSFLWTFWGCLSFWRHNECVSIEWTREVCVDMRVNRLLFLHLYRPVQWQHFSTNRNTRFLSSYWSISVYWFYVYIKKERADEDDVFFMGNYERELLVVRN